jgi:hypothetical protein
MRSFSTPAAGTGGCTRRRGRGGGVLRAVSAAVASGYALVKGPRLSPVGNRLRGCRGSGEGLSRRSGAVARGYALGKGPRLSPVGNHLRGCRGITPVWRHLRGGPGPSQVGTHSGTGRGFLQWETTCVDVGVRRQCGRYLRGGPGLSQVGTHSGRGRGFLQWETTCVDVGVRRQCRGTCEEVRGRRKWVRTREGAEAFSSGKPLAWMSGFDASVEAPARRSGAVASGYALGKGPGFLQW